MKTFKEIRDYAMEMYAAIATEQEKHTDAMQKLKDSGKYNEAFLKKMQDDYAKGFSDALKDAVGEFRDMVKDTCNGKREAIEKMLIEAPSNDQMNLLNSLKLQGTDIEPDEVRSIAAQLMDNYRSIHALEVIAADAGIRLSFPAQYDYQELKKALNRTEAYLNDRIRDIGNFTDRLHMDFFSKMFFGAWDGGLLMDDNAYQADAALLDSNKQIAPVPVVEKIQ